MQEFNAFEEKTAVLYHGPINVKSDEELLTHNIQNYLK